MKSVILVLAIMLSGVNAALAAGLPKQSTQDSKIWIDYSDLDYVLASSVLDMGPSTHERAHRVRIDSATRIYGGSRKASRFEGNRVAFHLFEDSHKSVLRAIRDDLLALPGQLNLQELSRNHQLAYWLNLHNAIVLAEMAEEYPTTNVRPMFDRRRSNSFINRAEYAVAGETVSLADIQDHILDNWQDPLVIYGFYMGAVGTPNIRKEAFRGDRVYDQLEENARNFVNSVRGTQIWDGSKLRVASYYQRMAAKFPNFDADILRHIQEYARPDFARRLITVREIEPEIDDWNIADLYNGHLHQAGRTGPRTIQGGDGTLLGQPNIPLHVVHALRGRINNFRRFEGTVEIEEVDAGTAEEEAEKKSPSPKRASLHFDLLVTLTRQRLAHAPALPDISLLPVLPCSPYQPR